MRRLTLTLLLVTSWISGALAQKNTPLPSRKMDELNWMEFRQIVPRRVKTVILTTGTLEPHGVTVNGADNLAPRRIAETLAPLEGINALIAPHIPYGVTGGMAPYPGATHIPQAAYRAYLGAVLEGLVRNGFHNIIVINGHGGPQTAILMDLTRQLALGRGVHTLVVNWWSACRDASLQVFGNTGGHAGVNETAFMQAIDPRLVRPQLISKTPTSANPRPGSWQATPTPTSITLYEPGQGMPTDFDQEKANRYFHLVNECLADLLRQVLGDWEVAGFH